MLVRINGEGFSVQKIKAFGLYANQYVLECHKVGTKKKIEVTIDSNLIDALITYNQARFPGALMWLNNKKTRDKMYGIYMEKVFERWNCDVVPKSDNFWYKEMQE